MRKWYGLSLLIGVCLMLVAVASTVERSEPLQAPTTANPTESPESSLTRLTEAYRASQTALRSAEASAACLKWDIDQLADEITREGYTIERIDGVLKLTPPAPKPQVRREPTPVAPKPNTQAAVEPKPQASGDGWQTARASWYGPGLFGNKTASGAVLTQGMMNVAVPQGSTGRFPFGTRIEFAYNGKTCVAVVNDTGAFAKYGRQFDLGPGTAAALGFSGVQTVEWRVL